ncbi:hypothetical protein [Aminobacter niigataensis]|uniref:hypothetical protein n=1 Tax=Aminobacter niigataensis TaxID=83265 RepID=UPI0024C72E07|nr:hypothetical protein [Aminobacter niigataensis]CAI2936166.1 protein of unknown function [Aminobacter niigataensis]
MPAPDLFGIKDYVRLLTAPAGMEAVHADGMSWAKNGLTYPESTKLTADEWNIIIGNLRGLLLGSGLDINAMDPASPLLLRDVVMALIIAKATDLLPGVVLANPAAVAEHVEVPAGSTAILNTHEAAGHLSAFFRGLLSSANGADARTALGVDGAIAAAITSLVNASPAALDTLAELATALGNDPNFATTITNALAGKVPTGRTIGVGGIATGGGDLGANRTITVPKATNPDAVAGTDDTKAMTAVRVKDSVGVFGLGGKGQTWQDMTASRVLGTSYQNASGRPIQIFFRTGANNNNTVQISPDNVTWMTIGGSSTQSVMYLYFIVPDGWFVKSNVTIGVWLELRT